MNPEAVQLCQRSIYRRGRWEPWVTSFLLDNLKEDSVLVDVGASVGWFSLLAAALSPKGKVFAYEPDHDRYSMLLKSKILNNFENLVVIDHALMNKSGRVGLGGRANALVSLEGDTIIAESLDDSLKSLNQCKVDFIKIDVEGAELRVLQGAGNTILRNPQIKLIVEFHPRWLKRFGGSKEGFFELINVLGLKGELLRGRYWIFSK